ncbi:MAG: ATP-binding protein [Bryobacterales bacterium]|nr:ATP-binding protein [Bryobacterales bacterium]
MADYRHPNVAELVKRLREEPRFLVLVTGPRQTGKTTAVRQALEAVELPSMYVAADEPEDSAFQSLRDGVSPRLSPLGRRDARWLYRIWQGARREALRSDTGFVLVVDEIQLVSGWARTVKGLWDQDRHSGSRLRVAILGSAPFLMQKDLGESLVGRFESLQFTHWSYPQMRDAFGYDLERYVYFGGSPGAAPFRDPVRWRRYVRTALVEPVIQRDVLDITRVDKPALLRQVFECGVRYSGQILSFNKMLGRLQDAGNTTTLARYLELLQTVGMLAGLQKYSTSVIQTRKSSPKLNVLNTAYVGALSDRTFAQARADRTFWGHLFESAVGAHLLNTGLIDETRVHYWKGRTSEVDFVLERGHHLVAVEVKSGRQLRSARGLAEFMRRFPQAKTLVVGATGIPLFDFLNAPASYWAEQ